MSTNRKPQGKGTNANSVNRSPAKSSTVTRPTSTTSFNNLKEVSHRKFPWV